DAPVPPDDRTQRLPLRLSEGRPVRAVRAGLPPHRRSRRRHGGDGLRGARGGAARRPLRSRSAGRRPARRGPLRGAGRAAARAPATIASNAIHPHDAWDWSDERIVDRTHAEIAEFAPAAATARVRHAVVHRIPMAIACPLPGTETLRPSQRTPFHNVWIAGD